ncbi:MAG: hypothetical protein KC656_32725, partial [Myxococcales bacterium]|nr:hypothetical protein [Myxococcales bacterium]
MIALIAIAHADYPRPPAPTWCGVEMDGGDMELGSRVGATPHGPPQLGLRTGGLGDAQDPCAISQVDAIVGGSLLVDTPDFYGRLQAVGAVQMRYRVHPSDLQVRLRAELVRLDQVIAPVGVSSLGLGATTIGVLQPVGRRIHGATAVHASVVLPTGYAVGARALGADLGVTADRRWWHGHVGLVGDLRVGRGPTSPRGAVVATGGVRHPRTPFVLDVPASFGWTGALD